MAKRSDRDDVDEVRGLPRELVLAGDFRVEPRCRVCRDESIRSKVNDLLATGTTYAMILRALGEDNAGLAERDRVTIDSVRNHTARHFPVQNAAKATYREILERRAQECGQDFVDGVATAITPLAFFEAVMVKGYQSLVNGEVAVDATTAMNAASKLQAVLDVRNNGTSIADMMLKVQQISDAVRSTVPEAMWADIVAKLGD